MPYFTSDDATLICITKKNHEEDFEFISEPPKIQLEEFDICSKNGGKVMIIQNAHFTSMFAIIQRAFKQKVDRFPSICQNRVNKMTVE